jgi:hypothetical protein
VDIVDRDDRVKSGSGAPQADAPPGEVRNVCEVTTTGAHPLEGSAAIVGARGRTAGGTALVSLFARVAAAEGWRPGEALRAFGDRSVYFAAYPPGTGRDKARHPVGGLQLVHSRPDGDLPCLSVWPELAPQFAGRSDVAHVAVLAIEKPWRGGPLSPFWPLCAALWRHCVETSIRELWLEATPRTLRCYQRLGWPLAIRGELREHWGEGCYLTSLSVREAAGALAEKAVRSETYRRIVACACAAPVGADQGG